MFSGAPGATYNWVTGFRFIDHTSFGGVSTLGIDPASGITVVELRNVDIQAPNATGAKLLDQPSKFVFRAGHIVLSTVAEWANPLVWDGQVTFLNEPVKGFLTLPKWTSTARPTTPPDGTIGYATDTKKVELFDGAAWQPLN